MDYKYEKLEKEIDLLSDENKALKKLLKQKEDKIKEVIDGYDGLRNKLIETNERYREQFHEVNNRLSNYDRLFQRLSKDMNYLNKTANLVFFEDSPLDIHVDDKNRDNEGNLIPSYSSLEEDD